MNEKKRLALLKAETNEKGQDGEKRKKARGSETLVERGSYAERLLQAGIVLPPQMYIALAVVAGCVAAFLAMSFGPILASFSALVVIHYMLSGYLAERAEKRNRKVIPQLPAFIDGLASALGTGFNIEGAVVQAAQGVPQGLFRTELDRIVGGLNRGLTVQEALAVLRQRISGREITSLAVAIGLFSSMGGTVLEPFRRLAEKIRDQQGVVEKAQRDLVQIKAGFYILLLLSVGTPVVLMLLQPKYLGRAFSDSMGRMIFQFAVIIQIAMILGFKRMMRLKI